MRYFFFLLFIATPIFAQIDFGSNTATDCNNATFTVLSPTSDNVYECRNVTITSPFGTADLVDQSLPLNIKATGTVSIDAIDFQGLSAVGNFGGTGGPGAGSGGDFLVSGNNGSPASHGGNTPTGTSTCSSPGDTAEGPGGGGGSLEVAGQNGFIGGAPAGTGVIGPAGLAGTLITFDINNFTFAGSGGGSGEVGCLNNAPTGSNPGGGGGGGGGIFIRAAGNVTITGGINVFGGDGGIATNIDGGGGGGSGGIIVIQSLANIILTGASLNADIGNGGANSTPSTIQGDGGDGAPGLIFLEDIDGIISGGTFTPTPTINPVGSTPTSESSSLKSDITCGTIAKPNDDQNPIMQMMMGFMLAFMLGLISKKKKS